MSYPSLRPGQVPAMKFNFQVHPFPDYGIDLDHIAWFKDKTNLDFHDVNNRTQVKIFNSLSDLIVQVTGLVSADALHNIFTTHIDLSESALRGDLGFWVKKPELIKKVMAAIERETAFKKSYGSQDSIVFPCYCTWLSAALMAYAPREISLARRMVSRPTKERARLFSERQQSVMKDDGGNMADKAMRVPPFDPEISSRASFEARQPPLKKFQTGIEEPESTQRFLPKHGQPLHQEPQFSATESPAFLPNGFMPVPGVPFEPVSPFEQTDQADGPDLTLHNWTPEPTTTNITTRNIRFRNGLYMPLFVNKLQPTPIPANDISNLGPNKNFDPNFLNQALGADQISPGCYSVDPESFILRFFPNITSYRVIAPAYDPLVPQVPGHHGAQISFLVPPVKYDGSQFPVFLKSAVGTGSRYLGMYRHPSTPDYLGVNEMAMLPLGLTMHWCNWFLMDEKARRMVENLIGMPL